MTMKIYIDPNFQVQVSRLGVGSGPVAKLDPTKYGGMYSICTYVCVAGEYSTGLTQAE